ncbi:MAG: hypothetical protein CMK32_09955 [Porticoccaceae bacterium]|nr:hypothetical protein [Porticoccaceae bacterium]
MKLISEEYRQLNAELHQRSDVGYGGKGYRHASDVRKFADRLSARTVLDYGCGKATLSEHLAMKVINYDPAIEEFASPPDQQDIVVCTDVLEHIEPDLLQNVLRHIDGLAISGIFAVIATRPDGSKLLADGSNPHKIIKPARWWGETLASVWGRLSLIERKGEVQVTVDKVLG